MSTYGVADAKHQLSQLIGGAPHGEAAVIRHRQPVAEMRPADAALRAMADADLDWLAALRTTSAVLPNDGAAPVGVLRDEWGR